ncbi:MAG TPA: peptidase M28, partial [bacterium]|nr:peptidase M28 [bacterium]
MDATESLLRELTEITGIAGFEHDVAKAIEKHMKPLAKITYDRLGSIICRKDGSTKGPKVMLAAHMDEVGFLVKQITKEGFIKFIPVGGWFSQVILGQRVTVKTRKGDVVGVVGSKPPHELDEE